MSTTKRFLADVPLPPYSYVPGRFPHPIREPDGHSYGCEEASSEPLTPAAWRAVPAYLRGFDLFHAGYYWEAHESWEAVWHAAGRKGTEADFCKALIKLAAAGVKAREGRAVGVKRHAQRAIELLDQLPLQGSSTYCGVDRGELRKLAVQLSRDPDAIVDTRPDPVVVVMPTRLPIEPP